MSVHNKKTNKGKAIILLSGGLDSATTLAIAQQQGFECFSLAFDYGQRHCSELVAGKIISERLGVKQHKVVHLDLDLIGGSALTDMSIDVPERELSSIDDEVPITYVPARNTIFLSIALGWAEVLDAQHIFIGVNAVDYSGYPDCRAKFIQAFENMANLATKMGVEGKNITIHTPLIDMSKGDIIKHGLALGVDYAHTVSCYQADDQGKACGCCDSCLLRQQGFKEVGVADPTAYQ